MKITPRTILLVGSVFGLLFVPFSVRPSSSAQKNTYQVCKEVTVEATVLREKNKVEVVGKACLHNGRWRLVEAEE